MAQKLSRSHIEYKHKFDERGGCWYKEAASRRLEAGSADGVAAAAGPGPWHVVRQACAAAACREAAWQHAVNVQHTLQVVALMLQNSRFPAIRLRGMGQRMRGTMRRLSFQIVVQPCAGCRICVPQLPA